MLLVYRRNKSKMLNAFEEEQSNPEPVRRPETSEIVCKNKAALHLPLLCRFQPKILWHFLPAVALWLVKIQT